MDATANNTGRKFPAYTIEDLKIAVMDYQLGIHPLSATVAPGHVEAMIAEVLRREAGLSVYRPTPQVGWVSVKMTPANRIGRM